MFTLTSNFHRDMLVGLKVLDSLGMLLEHVPYLSRKQGSDLLPATRWMNKGLERADRDYKPLNHERSERTRLNLGRM